MELIKKNLAKLIKNQLVAGSAILFVGTLILNGISYLFHLLMGRMLGPADYGLLASLISFTYLINIPNVTLNLLTVKHVSAWRGEKKLGLVKGFYFWLNKQALIWVLTGFGFLLLATPWLSRFLHLESSWQLWLMLLAALLGVFTSLNSSFLQGFLRFTLLSLAGIVQIGLKLILAVVLVWLGWRVTGAIWAFPISSFLALLVSGSLVYFLLLRKIKEKEVVIDGQKIFRYLVPVFFSTLAFTSLYTTDVVLVRHFLPGQESGFYAALANLGKIIYFAAYPISMVMFPMVSERHANGKDYQNLFKLSLIFVFLICTGVSALYFFFPKLMINLLYGQEYLVAAPELGLFALFISFYCLSYLIVNFYLSIKKTRVVVLPVLAALLQVALISLFHQTIRQAITMSMMTTFLLVIGLLIYHSTRKGYRPSQRV